jgi:hypothetical protein
MFKKTDLLKHKMQKMVIFWLGKSLPVARFLIFLSTAEPLQAKS